MAGHQAFLAIAVDEFAVLGAQTGCDNVFALGVQSAGDCDELQGSLAHRKRSIVNCEVGARNKLFLGEGHFSVFVHQRKVLQGVHRIRFRDAVILDMQTVFSKIAGNRNRSAVSFFRQRRTVIFLASRRDVQRCLGNRGCRCCHSQFSVFHGKVCTRIQVFPCKYGLAVLLQLVGSQGIYRAHICNGSVSNDQIVAVEVSCQLITFLPRLGQGASVVFLAVGNCNQNRRRYSGRIRSFNDQFSRVNCEVGTGIQSILIEDYSIAFIQKLIILQCVNRADFRDRIVFNSQMVNTEIACHQVALCPGFSQRFTVVLLALLDALQIGGRYNRLVRHRRCIRLLNRNGDITVDSADVVEACHICFSAVNTDRIRMNNSIKSGCGPLTADGDFTSDFVAFEQAGDLIAVFITVCAAFRKCNRLVLSLDGD